MGEVKQAPPSTKCSRHCRCRCSVPSLAGLLLSCATCVSRWQMASQRPSNILTLPLCCGGRGSRGLDLHLIRSMVEIHTGHLPVLVTTGLFLQLWEPDGTGPRVCTTLAAEASAPGPGGGCEKCPDSGLCVASPGRAASHPPRTPASWAVPLPVKCVRHTHWRRGENLPTALTHRLSCTHFLFSLFTVPVGSASRQRGPRPHPLQVGSQRKQTHHVL